MSTVALCGYNTVHLSTPLSMDIQVVFSLGLLLIKLQWTFVYKYLNAFISPGKIPGNRITGSSESFLIFKKLPNSFPKRLYHLYIFIFPPAESPTFSTSRWIIVVIPTVRCLTNPYARLHQAWLLVSGPTSKSQGLGWTKKEGTKLQDICDLTSTGTICFVRFQRTKELLPYSLSQNHGVIHQYGLKFLTIIL